MIRHFFFLQSVTVSWSTALMMRTSCTVWWLHRCITVESALQLQPFRGRVFLRTSSCWPPRGNRLAVGEFSDWLTELCVRNPASGSIFGSFFPPEILTSSLCAQSLCPLTLQWKDFTEERSCVRALPFWRPKATHQSYDELEFLMINILTSIHFHVSNTVTTVSSSFRSVTTTRPLQRFFPTSPQTSLASPQPSTTPSAPAACTWPKTDDNPPHLRKPAKVRPPAQVVPPGIRRMTVCQWPFAAHSCSLPLPPLRPVYLLKSSSSHQMVPLTSQRSNWGSNVSGGFLFVFHKTVLKYKKSAFKVHNNMTS